MNFYEFPYFLWPKRWWKIYWVGRSHDSKMKKWCHSTRANPGCTRPRPSPFELPSTRYKGSSNPLRGWSFALKSRFGPVFAGFFTFLGNFKNLNYQNFKKKTNIWAQIGGGGQNGFKKLWWKYKFLDFVSKCIEISKFIHTPKIVIFRAGVSDLPPPPEWLM